MRKEYSQLKKGDLVQVRFGGKWFIGVFKDFRGSDASLPKRSGGTINPSHYASIAFGRQSKAIERSDIQILSEPEIKERIEECKVAYAYFHKFHRKD